MSIREVLLADIQQADAELLKPLYEVWQILKTRTQPVSKSQNHPMEVFFGTINEDDAREMQEIIDREFSHIEGEW